MSQSQFKPPYCDAIDYQQILDSDTRPPPAVLRERSEPDLGVGEIPVEHYTDPEFFKAQIKKVWMRTWQMACREEEIPNVGDFHVYEVVGKSLIIVRTAKNEIKALYNSCLHRGRKLVSHDGCKEQFKCAFHGFTWKNDGTFVENPMAWDFPQCPADKMHLPEAKVGTWGGFVFVNFDPDAKSLESVLGVIPRHFERWRPEDRYMSAHVQKRVKANWMVCAEAFMESHHAITTHPQIMPFVTDANAQYDVFSDHVTRHISGRGYSSPFVTDRTYTQDEIAEAMLSNGGRGRMPVDGAGTKVPEGSTARAYVADLMRKALEAETGRDHSGAADAELGDSLIYNMFPNFAVWGGFIPSLVYRWLPDGKAHDSAIMEIRILRQSPKSGPRPPSAKLRFLGENEPWSSAAELGGLGPVVEQDWGNLPYVQEGLEASGTNRVHLGRYSEMRIRQQHLTLDAYMNDQI